jgi:hypothetical protein
MPQINKVFNLDITPEKFVNACDESELHEVILIAEKALQAKKNLIKSMERELQQPLQCTCSTAAAMKYCPKDCDEK